jgi:cytochrome c oxidase assembly protein subunit 15
MNRPSFRRYALFTTALTGILMSLGVYTAATGAGLACAQQWPLCDNGLLPQSIPSFIEWFHRLVAMITGFVIVGLTAWAWRSRERTTALYATAALVLLPLQISLGAVTVTLNGAIPGGYSVPTQAAHLLTAFAIFTFLALATLRAYRGRFSRSVDDRVRLGLGAALVLLAVSAVFTRATPVMGYVPAAQALFIFTSLAAFAVLVAVFVWLPQSSLASYRAVVGAALCAVVLLTLLGRDLVAYSGTVRLANLLLLGVAFALVAVVAWAARRVESGGRASLA